MKQAQPKRRGWNLLEYFCFFLFLLWSGAGLYFTTQHVTAAGVAQLGLPPEFVPFVTFCFQNGDPILILLAFINTHLHAVRQWTAGVARNWGLIIVLSAFVIETVGALTGFPFGEYHYTDGFGPVLWVVPLTIPLAWHVVVTNALFLVRAASPYASPMMDVVLTALLCTLYDFVLEPFATRVKHYWIWADHSVPAINYVSWFVLSGLLVWLFAPTLSTRFRADPRPALILGLTVMIFLAGLAAG